MRISDWSSDVWLFRSGRVAIETKKRHRGGEDAAALVLRFVQNLARRRCDDRVNLWRFLGAEMIGRYHPAQRRGERALRIGQEGRDARERLFLFGIEHVEDRSDAQLGRASRREKVWQDM